MTEGSKGLGAQAQLEALSLKLEPNNPISTRVLQTIGAKDIDSIGTYAWMLLKPKHEGFDPTQNTVHIFYTTKEKPDQTFLQTLHPDQYSLDAAAGILSQLGDHER